MRVGIVVEAQPFPEARRPALKLRIDFGPLGVKRSSAQITDHYRADDLVGELPDLLHPGDCLVVNDSRVIPARVFAEDAGGRRIELLFVEPLTPDRWRALVRPGRRCHAGVALTAGGEGGARLRVAAVES